MRVLSRARAPTPELPTPGTAASLGEQLTAIGQALAARSRQTGTRRVGTYTSIIRAVEEFEEAHPDLAEPTRITKRYISSVVTGRQAPSSRWLHRVARAAAWKLQIPVGFWVGSETEVGECRPVYPSDRASDKSTADS